MPNPRRRPLHVGVNALFLAERAGGVGRYTRNLLAALAGLEDGPQLTVYAGSLLPDEVLREPWADEVRWVRVPLSPRNPLNVAGQLAALPLLGSRHRLDLLHSPGNSGPLVAPFPTVLTLCDLIWLHHPADWDASRRAQASTRLLAAHAARASTRVVTISKATRDDLVATLGLEATKIDVTPLAADGAMAEPEPDSVLRERLGLVGQRYVLSVAQKRAYKRLDVLLTALEQLSDDVALVLVGPSTPHGAELHEQATRLGVEHRVVFLDWVPEETLEALYRGCSCFVLPSLIEGFGLPVLEAMRRGSPVACSNRSSLPEVAGEAALLFDPDHPAEVAWVIRRLLEDPALREHLSAAGRRRATEFSWRHTAELTMAAYERAIGLRP